MNQQLTPASTRFVFASDPLSIVRPEAHTCLIPSATNAKHDLLAFLATCLQFPKYFGNNWDALADCLGDLSWLQHKTVILIHPSVPVLDRKDLVTYLEVLSVAASQHAARGAHELIIVFPQSKRDVILDIVGG